MSHIIFLLKIKKQKKNVEDGMQENISWPINKAEPADSLLCLIIKWRFGPTSSQLHVYRGGLSGEPI